MQDYFAENNFNADDVEPSSFGPIPAGDYKAMLQAMETKTTKNGDGKYIAATFQIIEGECEGRLIWANYNIENASEKAVQIGKSELADFLRAVDNPRPKSTQELLEPPTPFILKVGIDKNDPERNRVKGYASVNGKTQETAPRTQPSTGSTQESAAPTDESAPKKRAPWKK